MLRRSLTLRLFLRLLPVLALAAALPWAFAYWIDRDDHRTGGDGEIEHGQHVHAQDLPDRARGVPWLAVGQALADPLRDGGLVQATGGEIVEQAVAPRLQEGVARSAAAVDDQDGTGIPGHARAAAEVQPEIVRRREFDVIDALDDNDGTLMPFADDCQRHENGMPVASTIRRASVSTSSIVEMPRSGMPSELAATPPPDRYSAL